MLTAEVTGTGKGTGPGKIPQIFPAVEKRTEFTSTGKNFTKSFDFPDLRYIGIGKDPVPFRTDTVKKRHVAGKGHGWHDTAHVHGTETGLFQFMKKRMIASCKTVRTHSVDQSKKYF